jgi:biopolymer transport protein ExbB
MRLVNSMNQPMPLRAALGFALATIFLFTGGAKPASSPTLDFLAQQSGIIAKRACDWYLRTPPMERITWGGLGASSLLGSLVLIGRSFKLRRGRIIPAAFEERFLARLVEGDLDRNKALDYCELNLSPASRVALGSIRRWGRSTSDLERGASLARQVEVDALRRHVGTLRRIAALAPLVGLLGTLTAAGRILATLTPGAASPAWGPALAGALGPLTFGVALAILALVAYDGLQGKVEALAGDLERVSAQTIDAITTSTAALEARNTRARADAAGPPRTPHQGGHPIRIPMPEDIVRQMDRERDR